MNGGKRSGNTGKLWGFILNFFNVILITVPFALCWYWSYADTIYIPFFHWGNVALIFLYAFIYFTICKLYSGFNVSIVRISELVYSQLLSILVTNIITYVIIFLLSYRFASAWELVVLFAVQACLAVFWSLFANKSFFRNNKPMRTVIVWDARQSVEELIKEYKLDKRFEVAGTYYINDCIDDIGKALGDAEAVFLCGIHSKERNIIVKYCIDTNIRMFVIPGVADIIMSSAEPLHILHLPIMTIERYDPSPEYLFIKRIADIVISGLALVILSPLMLVTALLVKRDGGTVFYKQKRLTKNRREFDIIKFRTMRMDAEKDGVARLSTGAGDDRVTKVGRVLRKFRIDEIPQLICVFQGTMSLVGPRPERPEIAAQYEAETPEFAFRLQAKAGLTGFAQVYGKYNTTPYDKLLMDLQYIARPTLVEDTKLLFATIKIIFMPESTEGIAEGQITASTKERNE